MLLGGAPPGWIGQYHLVCETAREHVRMSFAFLDIGLGFPVSPSDGSFGLSCWLKFVARSVHCSLPRPSNVRPSFTGVGIAQ